MSSTNIVLPTNHVSHQASEPTHLLPKGSMAHTLSSLVPNKEVWEKIDFSNMVQKLSELPLHHNKCPWTRGSSQEKEHQNVANTGSHLSASHLSASLEGSLFHSFFFWKPFLTKQILPCPFSAEFKEPLLLSHVITFKSSQSRPFYSHPIGLPE